MVLKNDLWQNSPISLSYRLVSIRTINTHALFPVALLHKYAKSLLTLYFYHISTREPQAPADSNESTQYEEYYLTEPRVFAINLAKDKS